MSRLRTAVLLLLAASLGGCVSAPSGKSAAADELLAADRAFAAKSAASTPAVAFAEFVAEDGIQLGSSGAPVLGREAISKGMAEGSRIILLWQPQFAEVASSGDFGWTWGEWQVQDPSAGGRQMSHGRYVNVWKKQVDGSWKVRLDMGNVAKEVPPAP